jgi:hypothetical protein
LYTNLARLKEKITLLELFFGEDFIEAKYA